RPPPRGGARRRVPPPPRPGPPAPPPPAPAPAPGRPLRPITAGMPRPPRAESSDRDLELAAFSPASTAIVPPLRPRLGLEDVVIDVIVAYTKAAASHYADIEQIGRAHV